MYPDDILNHDYLSQFWCFEGDSNVEQKLFFDNIN